MSLTQTKAGTAAAENFQHRDESGQHTEEHVQETIDLCAQPFSVPAVDDSAISRKLVQHSLLGQEYEVLFAKNGRETLDRLAEHQPAVVVPDWSMPDIGRLERCRRIRRDFQAFHSHLILLTSNSDRPQIVEGLAAGADD